MPGAGGPDTAADPEQRGRPVGAGEHDQAQVRRGLCLVVVCPEETAQVLLLCLHGARVVQFPSA